MNSSRHAAWRLKAGPPSLTPASSILQIQRLLGKKYLQPRRCIATTTFFYLKSLEEYKTVKPYHINVPQWALPQQKQSNEVSGPVHNVPVSGLRGKENNFSLDDNGFQVFKETDGEKESMTGCLTYDDYADPGKVLERARPAVESFLKRKLGAEVVVAFSHQVRRRDKKFPALPRGTKGSIPQPVQGVHVDYAPDWARSESRKWLERTDISDISGRRWQILKYETLVSSASLKIYVW